MPSKLVVNGTLNTLSAQQNLAADDDLFVVNCQSPGTAIAYAVLTAFSATANGLFVISNSEAVGGKDIVLHRLDLFQTATAPVGTTLSFEVYNETGVVTGTTAVITRTAVNVHGGPALNGVVQAFNAGAITIPAAVGTRTLVGQGWVPTGVNVVKDVITVEFGADAASGAKTGLTAARATDTARLVGQLPAVVIKPQTTSWINMWGCGTNAPSYEYNLVLSQV